MVLLCHSFLICVSMFCKSGFEVSYYVLIHCLKSLMKKLFQLCHLKYIRYVWCTILHFCLIFFKWIWIFWLASLNTCKWSSLKVAGGQNRHIQCVGHLYMLLMIYDDWSWQSLWKVPHSQDESNSPNTKFALLWMKTRK